jgi:hypothetical protein
MPLTGRMKCSFYFPRKHGIAGLGRDPRQAERDRHLQHHAAGSVEHPAIPENQERQVSIDIPLLSTQYLNSTFDGRKLYNIM